MKKMINLTVLSMAILADGRAAIVTKQSADNTSANGVHTFNPAQLERLCQRTIGFGGILGANALKQYIALANGSATLTFELETHKTGDTWENKVTGETGIYGFEKDGVTAKLGKDGKPLTQWSQSVNHEINLGFVASQQLANAFLTAGISNMSIPVAPKAPIVPQKESAGFDQTA